MKNKFVHQSLSTIRIIAISSLTIFTLYTVQAWVAPTLSAPNGNVGGPLTTATTSQIKTGNLGLTGTLVSGGFQLLTGLALTGNASGTVLTSDANGNASWQVAGGGVGGSFGPGYAWKNMTASSIGCTGSRSLSTTVCTNSSAYPIMVTVKTQKSQCVGCDIVINGVAAGYAYASAYEDGSFNSIVPPGATYTVGAGQGTVYYWAELRCDSGLNCSSGSNVPGSLGVGQTWQDVTSIRTLSTSPYTNSTGKPIEVAISAVTGASSGNIWCFVGAVQVSMSGDQSGSRPNLSFVVPNGSTYYCTSNGSISLYSWSELR